MSTRFEKRIILPRGAMGPTTLLGLSQDDRRSVERWHRPEWEQFVQEITAYKFRVLESARSAYMRVYDKAQKCEKCRKRRAAIMRAFNGPKKQRGSIILSTAQGAAAAGDCGFTASTIPNLNRFQIEPTNSFTGAQLNGDGDWYHQVGGSINFGSSRGTWASDCAIADYDTRWNQNTGSTLTGSAGSDGTWSAGTSTKEVYYYITGIGLLAGTFDMQCRDGTSLNILFTDSFSMTCEVDARN